MKTSLTRARSVTKSSVAKAAEKPGAAQKTKPNQKPNQKTKPKPTAKKASAKKATAKPASPVASTPAPSRSAALAKAALAKAAPQKKASQKIKKISNAKSGAKTSSAKTTAGGSSKTRATKKRAPKDLALQYGGKAGDERAPAAEAAPRKRRDPQARAKLREVMAPSEGVLLRLARAGAISASLAPAHAVESAGNGRSAKVAGASRPRRSRRWEARCGKCGASGQYSAAAALCVRCGTILVRD